MTSHLTGAAFVRWKILIAITLVLAGCRGRSEPTTEVGTESTGLTLVVMDPLAAPLSCPCVEGYAQRQYEALATFLQDQMAVPVRVVFGESLAAALNDGSAEEADLIIGKDSVVRADAQAADLPATPIAHLTDKQGRTTQTGLFVVRSDDPSQSLADLAGYRILLGPADCDEKHAAARRVLAATGIELPEELVEISQACSDGACKLVDAGPGIKAAAVISSYAQPLLEGCGTIKAGDLRVVGETEPVAFISVFVADHVDAPQREQIERLLARVGEDRELCKQLETLLGFVPSEQAQVSVARKKN